MGPLIGAPLGVVLYKFFIADTLTARAGAPRAAASADIGDADVADEEA